MTRENGAFYGGLRAIPARVKFSRANWFNAVAITGRKATSEQPIQYCVAAVTVITT